MYTPTMTIAGLGFLRNTGLRPSRTLEELVAEFSTQHISGTVQSALSRYGFLYETLKLAPCFMTGFEPPGIDIGTGSITNIPLAIRNQGRTFFSHPSSPSNWYVPSYINSYTLASGYSLQTYRYYNVLETFREQPHHALGFQYKDYQDIYTCGASNQFDINRLPDLARELPNAGSMYSTADLANINDPASIAKNLIDLGLGKTGDLEDKIIAAGINLNNPSDADRVQLVEIFRSIQGNDLREIIEVTGFKPNKPEEINSLADVLESHNVFSEQALSALGPETSFNELARKLSNIGGRFMNMTGLSQLYGGIKTLSLPLLQSLHTVLPDSYIEGLEPIFGRGTGEYHNTTMNDLVATASGVGYIEDLRIIIEDQKFALATRKSVMDFVWYLNNIDLETFSLSTLAELINQVNIDPALQEVYIEAGFSMLNCAERLYAERMNLQIAGINPGTAGVSNLDLVNFSSQLHAYGRDSYSLSLGDQLHNNATDDVYGEAVKACVIEGKNLAKMARYGIDPGIKVDPSADFSFPTSVSD